jgi:hypothetical protein
MRVTVLTDEQAGAVWQVLVDECGANADDESMVYQFKHYVTTHTGTFGHEFRFMGALGFGGKFYINGGGTYVSCYPEDQTPERLAMIDLANDRIHLITGED